MLDHLLGNINVGDNPVTQRTDRLDTVRRLAHHHLGIIANRLGLAHAVDGFHRDH